MRRKKKQKVKADSQNGLGKRLGEALSAVLQQGGSVEIRVKKKNDNPFNEEEPTIPDWLK